jgi:stage II sporulation protein AB (anti-sigma F factor)
LIRDFGKGIENVALAMSPFYTTKPDMERSGMGFTFMESFTDGLKVESHVGEGTSVTLTKTFL